MASQKIAAPLTNLTRKNIAFKWTQVQTDSFNALKKALTQAPVLKCADPDVEYQVTSDASDTGTRCSTDTNRRQKLQTCCLTRPKHLMKPNKIIALRRKNFWNNSCITNLEIVPSWCKIYNNDGPPPIKII